MMLIVSALSLLVVPDFLLFTWQRGWAEHFIVGYDRTLFPLVQLF